MAKYIIVGNHFFMDTGASDMALIGKFNRKDISVLKPVLSRKKTSKVSSKDIALVERMTGKKVTANLSGDLIYNIPSTFLSRGVRVIMHEKYPTIKIEHGTSIPTEGIHTVTCQEEADKLLSQFGVSQIIRNTMLDRSGIRDYVVSTGNMSLLYELQSSGSLNLIETVKQFKEACLKVLDLFKNEDTTISDAKKAKNNTAYVIGQETYLNGKVVHDVPSNKSETQYYLTVDDKQEKITRTLYTSIRKGEFEDVGLNKEMVHTKVISFVIPVVNLSYIIKAMPVVNAFVKDSKL